MSPIHLGSPISVELDGQDLTPYLADQPDAAVTLAVSMVFNPGPWQRYDIAQLFEVPSRMRAARRPESVTRTRRAYRAKRRHW